MDGVLDRKYGATALRLSGAGEECGIMHEVTTAVRLPPLPDFWVLPDSDGVPVCVCTARLSCGHAFHVSALALHLVTNTQRCPLCRQGAQAKLDIAELPADVRAVMREYVNKAFGADSDDDTPTFIGHIELDDSVFERDLTLVLEAWQAGQPPPEARSASHWSRAESEVVVSCPVVPVREDNGWQVCRLQRWWKRVLFSLSERPQQMLLRFAVRHPLLCDGFVSNEVAVDDLNGSVPVAQRDNPADVLALVDVNELDAELRVNIVELREQCTRSVQNVLSLNTIFEMV